MRPRICLVHETFHPVVGGGESQGLALAAGLAARGCPTSVVTLRRPAHLPERDAVSGCAITRLAPGRGRWGALAPMFRHLRARRGEFDLIYVSGLRALGLPAVAAGRLAGVPVVLRADNNGELSGAFFDPGLARLRLSHDAWPVRPLNALRQAVLRRADHFVAVAESIRREFAGQGVAPHKVSLIPYGVDLERFHPPRPGERAALRAALGLPPAARIVCFVGRLVAWKGPLTLLRAWRGVLSLQRQERFREAPPLLLFAGAGGADQDNCEEEARRLVASDRLGESVRFLGDVRNVDEYLRAADIFVLPTVNDAFAVAAMEAMASGCAVITTRTAGLADYVVADVNALVVPPQDPFRLMGALLRLVEDALLRVRVGRAARATAEKYSHALYVERHVELFRRLAGGDAGGARVRKGGAPKPAPRRQTPRAAPADRP